MSDAGAGRAEDLALALAAVREAGRVVMETFGTDPYVRHKSPDQPVTDADLEADALLRARLTGERPGYGWLSEESADRPDRLERHRVWIVDPVDGTRSFIAGYREFAVSIALAEAGRPAVGVIYNPAQAHVTWATTGNGAYEIEGWTGGTAGARRLDARGRRDQADADRADGARADGARADGDRADVDGAAEVTLLASRSERAAGEFEPFEGAWTIREVGSTAWKLASVAMGRGSYISRGPKSEWDVAAGVLIVEEAGGVVTDLDGNAVVLNRREPYVHGVAAGPEPAHARLLARARALPSPRLGRDAWKGDDEG